MTDQSPSLAKAVAGEGRYVDDAPFDPAAAQETGSAELKTAWQLAREKFRRHRLAVWSLRVLILLYVMMALAEIISPYNYRHRDTDHIYAPPQGIGLFHEGSFVGPYVHALQGSLNDDTLAREYRVDTSTAHPIRFFCMGQSYRLFGLIEGRFHLICPPDGASLHLLGTDRMGRDQFARILVGARISLTVGLVGVAVSMVLGIVLGGLAGYFGGWIDAAVLRLIEVIRAFPELPLWMALSAAIPDTWNPLAVFFGITIILGLLDWTGMARAVRSKLLSLREEDFAMAAKLMGASSGRIVFRHLVPNFASHILASATLAIPAMILGETALSFLGLGLQWPLVSWGILLTDAQNMSVVVLYPWLMLPVVPVVITVLAFNFVGDGLRDAADPYR